MQAAKECGAFFLETSAKADLNVDALFAHIAGNLSVAAE